MQSKVQKWTKIETKQNQNEQKWNKYIRLEKHKQDHNGQLKKQNGYKWNQNREKRIKHTRDILKTERYLRN